MDKGKRRFLKGAGIGFATALTIGSIPGVYWLIELDGPSDRQMLEVFSRIKSGEVIKKFRALPVEEQSNLLDGLDEFVLKKTKIGRDIKDLDTLVNVNEVMDASLPSGTYQFNCYTNTIAYSEASLNNQVLYFLAGNPLVLLRSHEYLHAIQDANSPSDKFETFFKEFIPSTNAPRIKFTFSRENAGKFATEFMGSPEASYTRSKQEFIRRWDEYTKNKPEMMILREIHANATVQPYTEASMMGDYLHTINDLQIWMNKVTTNNFNAMFEKTIELMGILKPAEAAKFVGEHGTDALHYGIKVSRLTQEEGLDRNVSFENMGYKSLAFRAGIFRQRQLFKDMMNIIYETTQQIDTRYNTHLGR